MPLCDNSAAPEFHHVILHVKGSALDFKQRFVSFHMQKLLIRSVRTNGFQILRSSYDKYAEFLMIMFVQSIGQTLEIKIEMRKAKCRQNNLLINDGLIIQHTNTMYANDFTSCLDIHGRGLVFFRPVTSDIPGTGQRVHTSS